MVAGLRHPEIKRLVRTAGLGVRTRDKSKMIGPSRILLLLRDPLDLELVVADDGAERSQQRHSGLYGSLRK